MTTGSDKHDTALDHRVSFCVHTFPRIEDMGLYRTSDLWAHMDRIIDNDVMIFVRKGLVHIIEDGVEYEVTPGQAFFMKHGVRHYGHRRTPAGSEWYWITFTPAALEEGQEGDEAWELQGSSLHGPVLPDKAVIRMKLVESADLQHMCVRLNKLLDHYDSRTAYDGLKLHIGVLELLVDLHREMTEKTKAGSRLVHDVKKYVHQHLYSTIRSADLTQALQMNYSYMSRAFSQATGLSIQRYIMEQKMKEAIRLFGETSLNISQISERLGYANPYYFTRVFRQVTGHSPTSFLKRGYYDYSSKD
ncbi:AraC family transcriptional regulator [Paenibacillus sp. YYML68]|uniref:helix-turn-helix domain-containing protein n=1 Tax=Paenibacillus sp. YYML68 TaxID=2909250 RepID=UPI00249218BF|nr:AraC family transcriptional regulator [Paenibacillus sp. YYML68]